MFVLTNILDATTYIDIFGSAFVYFLREGRLMHKGVERVNLTGRAGAFFLDATVMIVSERLYEK